MDFLYQAVLAIIISLSRYLPQDQAEIMAHQIMKQAFVPVVVLFLLECHAVQGFVEIAYKIVQQHH